MAMALKVLRCITSLSRPSLSPAVRAQRRLSTQLNHRFISSSGKDGEAAIKVDTLNQRIDASTFKDHTAVEPTEVRVLNGPIVDVIMLPSTGIFKSTTIMGEGSRTIYLDRQTTTLMDPCSLHPILPIYSGLYGNLYSRMHPDGWETKKVIAIAREHASKLNGAYLKGILSASGTTGSNEMSIKYLATLSIFKKHITTSQIEDKCLLDLCRHFQDEVCGITSPAVGNNGLTNLEHLEKGICPDTLLVSIMTVNNEIEVIQQMEEIGKLHQKLAVFFHINGAQVIGRASVDVSKWNMDWRSIFSPKIYGLKHIGAGFIRCSQKVGIGPLIADWGQEHVLGSGNLAHSLMIGFGEARRIAQEDMEYTHTSVPFLSQHSIFSSTMQGDNYRHKSYHNNQSTLFTRTFRTRSHIKVDKKKGKRNATGKSPAVGILEANSTEVPNSEAAEDTTNKWRNTNSAISYSKITIAEAEDRLGLSLGLLGIPVKEMLEGKPVLLGPDMIVKLKRKIYQDLENYRRTVGNLTEANVNFQEANINDNVAFTIVPIVAQFTSATERKLHFSREKEITSQDSCTSGMEEAVVLDYVSYNQKKSVLVAEAKWTAFGEARKQCFLALKDMRDFNGGGTVYGFITTGESWRMISFDGEFKVTENIELLFDSMGKQEERWMADYSILVECLNVAFSNGGKDPVQVV